MSVAVARRLSRNPAKVDYDVHYVLFSTMGKMNPKIDTIRSRDIQILVYLFVAIAKNGQNVTKYKGDLDC